MHSCVDLRVRYQETDQMGVVYHANYLVWFEIGRTTLLRELGYSYRELEQQGIVLPVVDVQAQYRAPALYDDIIQVQTQIQELTARKIEFRYQIIHQKEQHRLCEGNTRHLWVSKETKRSVSLKRQAPEFFQQLMSIRSG